MIYVKVEYYKKLYSTGIDRSILYWSNIQLLVDIKLEDKIRTETLPTTSVFFVYSISGQEFRECQIPPSVRTLVCRSV